MRIVDGATLYFSATFLTMGLSGNGLSFDPCGEYATTAIPRTRQYSTSSVCVQALEDFKEDRNT